MISYYSSQMWLSEKTTLGLQTELKSSIDFIFLGFRIFIYVNVLYLGYVLRGIRMNKAE